MEKFNELREKWIVTLKTLKSVSTQTLYFLIEPDNDNKFFESVDSFKDCLEGTQFTDFQILAIVYLLEYKKQNKPKIITEPNIPGTDIHIPGIPVPVKPYTSPNTSPDNPFGPFDKPFGPLGPIVTYSTTTLT